MDMKNQSLAAHLLLPLNTLAYGVPSHTFMDYFLMSQQYARNCCKQFDRAMKRIYMKEYLRLPTATDLKNIVKLHKSVHSANGSLLGSLDCTHTPSGRTVPRHGRDRLKEKNQSL
jgi:hypothetical protein